MKKEIKILLTLVFAITIILSSVGINEVSAAIKYGDVNGSGTINAEDALIVLKYAAKLVRLDESELAAANFERDSEVNATDALKILKCAANLLTPAEKSSFELKNDLSEEYKNCFSKQDGANTKCKINRFNYTISNSVYNSITISLKFVFEKTYQNTYDATSDDICVDYTLYRDDIAVRTGSILIRDTKTGVQYETTENLRYLEEGNYTLVLESHYVVE